MLASTASTPAQGGAIIRFSGTKEAKNEVEVSSSRRDVSEKKRDRRKERDAKRKRRESVPPMTTMATIFFSLFLSLSSREVAE